MHRKDVIDSSETSSCSTRQHVSHPSFICSPPPPPPPIEKRIKSILPPRGTNCKMMRLPGSMLKISRSSFSMNFLLFYFFSLPSAPPGQIRYIAVGASTKKKRIGGRNSNECLARCRPRLSFFFLRTCVSVCAAFLSARSCLCPRSQFLGRWEPSIWDASFHVSSKRGSSRATRETSSLFRASHRRTISSQFTRSPPFTLAPLLDAEITVFSLFTFLGLSAVYLTLFYCCFVLFSFRW